MAPTASSVSRATVPAAPHGRPAMTRYPSWRMVARGTGLPSPRGTVARIDPRVEGMTDRILGWLRKAPLDSRETALRIGCSQKNVNYHLGKLRDRGKARFDGRLKRWVMTDAGDARLRALDALDTLLSDYSRVLGIEIQDRLLDIRATLDGPRA